MAGQKGKPLTLARTRSPRLNWPLALALLPPRLRDGAMASPPPPPPPPAAAEQPAEGNNTLEIYGTSYSSEGNRIELWNRKKQNPRQIPESPGLGQESSTSGGRPAEVPARRMLGHPRTRERRRRLQHSTILEEEKESACVRR